MKQTYKVSIKILPFGSVSYELQDSGEPSVEKKESKPIYTVPMTTNIDSFEIPYSNGETYIVPKTTGNT
jgi:hypothetical protein